MLVDDRGDEQRVLDQLREFLEGVEKKQNLRMMVETGLVAVLAVLVVAALILMGSWYMS